MITTIKNHRVQHGNVMDGIDNLMQGEKAKIIYSDPPWGAGNLKYWQTMNTKANNVPQVNIDFDEFLNKIFSISKQYCKELLFVEYGVRWHDEIKQMADRYGFVNIDTLKCQYKSGSRLLPLDLHIFSKPNVKVQIDPAWRLDVYETHGYKTLTTALKPFVEENEIILDMCCGMGYTAQIAIDYNMQFRGNEINEKRLAV